uniref:REPA_OB_2 domain-containing protein n=1 Tax=Heterorhabditis bacteriophora TaxID=37862 RepID=A0A1I7XQW7_HETBA
MAKVTVTPALYRKYGVNGELRLSCAFFQVMLLIFVNYFSKHWYIILYVFMACFSDSLKMTALLVSILSFKLWLVAFKFVYNKYIVDMTQSRIFAIDSAENTTINSCARARLSDGVFNYSACFFDNSLRQQFERDNLLGKASEELGGEIIAVNSINIKFDGNVKGCAQYAGYKPSIVVSIPWGENDISNGAPMAKKPAPTRQPASFGSANVTPISMITPYVSKWRICGICTAKEELKTIKSRNGDMKITDRDGGTIRLAGFGETAERAYSIIQTDCSYYIAGGTVKQANKRFNTTGHDYELTLRTDTEITPCHDMIPKPAFSLKICPLDRIPQHKDETIDVLAVVDKLEPLNEFTARSGRDCIKREIQLVDRSGTVVQFVLWGEQAKSFEEEGLGQVIGIKGAQVKEWNGDYDFN